METINGTIQSVSCNEGISKTTNQPFTRWVFLINDKKYSTFDKDIGTKFKAGQNVEMEGETDGKYWNMKTMKEFAGTVKVASGAPQSNNGFTTMYVSYAKDIYNNWYNRLTNEELEKVNKTLLMGHAIQLVKQAKEAFE